MRRIIITGAGGSASTNYVRSLRMAKEDFHIIGADCNPYYLQRAETDEKYLIPKADDPMYIPALNELINKTKAQFLHAQNDAEVGMISEHREEIQTLTFLPPKEVVKICQDKWESRKLWEKAGIEHPKTVLLNRQDDLWEFIEHDYYLSKNEFWVRDIKGAGGKGSLRSTDFQQMRNWIDDHDGWGHYTVAEYLSEKTTTFTTIWKNGILVAGQGRKRIYWELGPAFISGVSGATGGGETDNDPKVADMAIKAIKAIDENPHGIYAVDLTYGKDGVPYPTEINIGRFFTTHLFFAQAGFNMAYIYTRLGLGDKMPIFKINPLPEGLVWIRGLDFKPVLTTKEQIGKCNSPK